ncbi:tail fiber domain-containing protein [uncultured Pantoea sp.]|uniref:tail fiber domain-containing protein n=1 Tax=uncultured Pantoea sp. TaxID=218084 RepID=UPI0025E7C37A|nr:tail fiber domain-containing protein [uncultured Pantoea sp.]
MPAGTIALTNGSNAVTGTGTSFTTELKQGDFVYVTVGSAPYTLVVSSVTSNTQLTLSVAFDGPTTSGLAWNAVPASMQVAITQKILNDFAQVARDRILDFQNWQKIYSDDPSVTVVRPDRTQFTGPSWGYMASQYVNKASKGANADITSLSGLTTALSPEQGGTGQKTASASWKALLDGRTAATARTDLQLGSAAIKDSGTSEGNLMPVGSAMGTPSGDNYKFFQISGDIEASTVNLNSLIGFGTYYRLIPSSSSNSSPVVSSNYWYIQNIGRSGVNAITQFALPYGSQTDAGRMFFRAYNSNAWAPWKEVTVSAVSDENAKNIGEDLDLETSLSNVVKMEFKNFTFKNDESNTPRRGVISQQINTIDPQYVKRIGDLLHLDQTPMLLDGLASIKTLAIRDDNNKNIIKELINRVELLEKKISS